jgi:8-oxo-dGTP pyrophosphatase MutT (NUDIX family)
LKKSFLQIPAGTADSKDVFQQAKKELLEETGIEAVKWEKLGGFYQGIGHETTYANIFLAQELDLSGLKIDNQESNEGIEEIIKVSLPKLKKMILKGEIECAMTLAAFNLFFLKMGK